jgi:hypothetical protein
MKVNKSRIESRSLLPATGPEFVENPDRTSVSCEEIAAEANLF